MFTFWTRWPWLVCWICKSFFSIINLVVIASHHTMPSHFFELKVAAVFPWNFVFVLLVPLSLLVLRGMLPPTGLRTPRSNPVQTSEINCVSQFCFFKVLGASPCDLDRPARFHAPSKAHSSLEPPLFPSRPSQLTLMTKRAMVGSTD